MPLAKHREPPRDAGQGLAMRHDAAKQRQISNENGSDLNSTRDDSR
jgi:hypothetical protein